MPLGLLCDADGTLFPSEEPAFDASAAVTNRFLAEVGARRRVEATQLRLETTGRNFRTTATDLARREGIAVAPTTLEKWVRTERDHVTRQLGAVLTPSAHVRDPLQRLARRLTLAVVSSSALARVDACLRATALDDLFPAERRFSAEDSLAVPRGKPAPDVYDHAGARLGIAPHEGLAIEDAVPGVQSATRAGFRALGFVMFVASAERPLRTAQLLEAGAAAVASSWTEVEAFVGSFVDEKAGAAR